MIQYNNFLMKREQSRAGSRFAECEKSRLKAKILITLALLLTAVTGAWAQSYEAKVFDVPASWAEDNTHISAADLPKDFVQITKDEAKALAVPDGDVVLVYGFVGENVLMMAFDNGTAIPYDDDDGAPVARGNFIMFQTMAKVCYTTPAGPEVAWNASTKTGTFSMPGSDVVLTPIYAKAAAFATTGTEPEVKALLPEAAEGVIAGTDASLIAEGTGIVAFAGTSTEVTQGTLMYAIGTSATEAPAPAAFSATVPTAKDYDDAATLYVWYYIKGADAPQGEAATLDNTFNDSEICTTPLKVTVLTNKFDIQFNAANANTIEADKATVTVGGTDKTGDITEGKLQGVKMGREVKVKANTGYKFRKVEVKKGGAAVMTTVTWNSSNVFNSAHEDVELDKWSPTPLTYEGITISFSGTKVSSFQAYDEVEHKGSLICYGNNGDSFTFTAPSGKKFCKIEIINNGFMVFTNYGDWTSDTSNKIVWSGTAATAVTLGSVFTDADNLNSIVFYLSE